MLCKELNTKFQFKGKKKLCITHKWGVSIEMRWLSFFFIYFCSTLPTSMLITTFNKICCLRFI